MNERFTVTKYGTRYWALYDGDALVCVAAYKKGAVEVKRRLEELITLTSLEPVDKITLVCGHLEFTNGPNAGKLSSS